ncbi:wd repeat-containing protein [Diaporthe amygdali]|uniref:wd repeat-containing protein n=1 Tax=Phomopsis amygdali TaxID=1214568 RepID=UPI0022FDEA04|nr:wd repeat-containing protein [Diaporthe amygdali]KAJ0118679.1 wd repeat-containing protein [Diaporthe amygdali]
MSNQDQGLDPDLPPQPKAILRGHKAQVHAAAFIRSNQRLLTGDADGYVVAWDLAIMRPTAVWQAHGNAILGISEWRPDKVITHGRDNKLIVWRLTLDDEPALASTLPLDTASGPRPKPWMLHLLEVNTMNFCSFASSAVSPATPSAPDFVSEQPSTSVSELLIAVPNTLASEAVDIYHLPSQTRIHTVRLGQDNGMAMALALAWLDGVLTLVVGYENGLAVVAQLDGDGSGDDDGFWTVIYRNQSHSQPILSLDVAPNREYFLTTGADAVIAKHPLLPQLPRVAGLIRDVPETEIGSKIMDSEGDGDADPGTGQGNPSSALSTALGNHDSAARPKARKRIEIQTQPIKSVDTKHSGQQGLRIRSDGRIFATAGWDSKTRVYSTKSMREVAVLKWHTVGCFSVAFADVTLPQSDNHGPTQHQSNDEEAPSATKVVSRMLKMTVKERRINQAMNAHWLAAGSKDGKVSLWDMF